MPAIEFIDIPFVEKIDADGEGCYQEQQQGNNPPPMEGGCSRRRLLSAIPKAKEVITGTMRVLDQK